MSIFNIRVYALLINNQKEVLVADEFRFGKEMTKFPGGGLHWGEGTIDCLKRECLEELGCEIEIVKHFYTTDFFQQSAFDDDHQLISIYYIVKAKRLTPALSNLAPPKRFAKARGVGVAHPSSLPSVRTELRTRYSIGGEPEGAWQSFRWIKISKINPDDFTFPVDKKVAEMLKADYSKSGR